MLSTPRLAILAGIAFSTPAFAVVSIDYVTVGNAGNEADTQVMNDATTGYGAVAHAYNIGKNEVTISQYADFLNAAAKTDTYGLWNSNMGTDAKMAGITRSGGPGTYSYTVTGSGLRPITYVSWYDAARFTNWLGNGQGSGDTETGAYTLTGNTGIITKNVSATVWIPSEDEWYKAAYYDPTKNAGSGGYWLYANQSNTMTSNTVGVAGAANFYDGDYVGSGNSSYPSGNALTNVGAYGANSDSYYGTNDQAGNVHEWNDAVISGSSPQLRGGAWNVGEGYLRSSYRSNDAPTIEYSVVGFRVASVPEPTSFVLTMLASGFMLVRRKR